MLYSKNTQIAVSKNKQSKKMQVSNIFVILPTGVFHSTKSKTCNHMKYHCGVIIFVIPESCISWNKTKFAIRVLVIRHRVSYGQDRKRFALTIYAQIKFLQSNNTNETTINLIQLVQSYYFSLKNMKRYTNRYSKAQISKSIPYMYACNMCVHFRTIA